MFCNYCRSLNPNDSVYCSACGRTIKLSSGQSLVQPEKSVASDAPETSTPEILDAAPVTELDGGAKLHQDYAGMDDHELSQLQEVYREFRMPLPAPLQQELELRALAKELEEIREQPDAELSDDLSVNADDAYPQQFDMRGAQTDFLATESRVTESIGHIRQPIQPSVEKARWWEYLAGPAMLLVALIVLLALGAAFILGVVWVSAKLYPIVEWLSLLGVLVFLVCLPLSVFKRIRRQCGKGMVGVSYLWGLGLWMYSILCLYDLWGIAGIYIGFFTVGYVTVPLACIALLFHGEWSLLGQIVLWFVIVFCMRMLGHWIISKGAGDLEFYANSGSNP